MSCQVVSTCRWKHFKQNSQLSSHSCSPAVDQSLPPPPSAPPDMGIKGTVQNAEPETTTVGVECAETEHGSITLSQHKTVKHSRTHSNGIITALYFPFFSWLHMKIDIKANSFTALCRPTQGIKEKYTLEGNLTSSPLPACQKTFGYQC